MTVFWVILEKVWIFENVRQDKQKDVEQRSEEKVENRHWGSCWGASATMLVKGRPFSTSYSPAATVEYYLL